MVNDLPVFSNYEEGGLAVDYPINDAILGSGKQSIEIKILSAKAGENISKYARAEIKIYVKEANKEASGRNMVLEVPMINFNENKFPVNSNIYSFVATVPYKNRGWESSINLKTIDKNVLIRALEDKLHIIMLIYNSRNEKEYNKFFENRNEEHNRCFYLTKTEIEDNKDTVFYGLPQKIESINKNLYKLVFYGNDKLVSLQAKHQPPGFVFESINKDEYGFTEMVLFHIKDKNSSLEAIR
ncbi:MAG TPA: hypothetical protein VF677_10080 [Flavobacterium sp.]